MDKRKSLSEIIRSILEPLLKDAVNKAKEIEIHELTDPEHEEHPDCWCYPVITHVDPVTGVTIYTHNDIARTIH